MNNDNEQNPRVWLRGFRYSLALFPSMTLFSHLLSALFPGFQASFVTLGFTLLLTVLVVATVFAFRHKREIKKSELKWISAFCALWIGLINFIVLIRLDDGDKSSTTLIIAICFAIAILGYWIFILAYNKNTAWIFRFAIKSVPLLQTPNEGVTAKPSNCENKNSNASDMYIWLSKINKQEYCDSFQSIGHSLKSVLEMNYDEVFSVVKNQEDSNAIFIHIMKSSKLSQDLRDKEWNQH